MVKKGKDIKKNSKNNETKPKEHKQKKATESNPPPKQKEKSQDQIPLKKKIKKEPKYKDILETQSKNVVSKKTKKQGKIENIKKSKPIKQSENKKKEVQEKTNVSNENVESINNYHLYITEKLSKIDKLKEKVLKKVQLDKKLILKAVKVLLDHNEKTKNPKNILDTNEGFIYVEISFNKLPEHYSVRPIQIKLPHPIYSVENQSRFAIIVRDPQRAFKDKIQEMNIPLIEKVIGHSKLTKKYPTYEDKRKLCNSFDYFFCDYKIYDLLRKPTGKFFYSRKKIPFPIDIDNVPKHLENEIKTYEQYLNDLGKHAYFMMGNGPVYTFKPARVSMGVDHILSNIIEGIQNILPWILDNGLKIKHIEQIDLKLFNSISLPIYNYLSKKSMKAYLE